MDAPLGGQIDVMPTILGFLNQPYLNNSFGINLLETERPCIFFEADTNIGCLDNDFFYLYKSGDASEGLYQYPKNDVTDYQQTKPNKKRELKNYAFSMLQTAQSIINNRQTK